MTYVGMPGPNVMKEGVNEGTGQKYFEIVTPTVRRVVRNHFNCDRMMGARLEVSVIFVVFVLLYIGWWLSCFLGWRAGMAVANVSVRLFVFVISSLIFMPSFSINDVEPTYE